jgi:hypothetical protein
MITGAAKRRRPSKKRNALGAAPRAKGSDTLRLRAYHSPLKASTWRASFLQGNLKPIK